MPARRFPGDDGPAGPAPARERVELEFDGSGLLQGSAGGQPVQFALTVPRLAGAAGGILGGAGAWATWTIGSNYDVYPDVPAQLTGSFAGEPAELSASFRLEPGYFLALGTITGRLGAAQLDAAVERASGGLGSSSTVAVDGRLGGAEFTLCAAVSGSLDTGKIRGSVDGRPVRLDAARSGGPGDRGARLAGRFAGPPALLALAAGAFLYFL